jgi:hypothetical protein
LICGRSVPVFSTRSASSSMTAFVLLLLSTVSMTALNTPEWSILENAIGAHFAGSANSN